MSKKITVYTRSTCPPCRALKTYLNNKGVTFNEVDVDLDPSAYKKIIDITGLSMVPQTVFSYGDQQEIVTGFNLSRISSLI